MASYTTVDQVDLATVSTRYALDEPRLASLPGGAANSSFRLSASSGEFVLTILDNHDSASAKRLAAHTQAVFELGVPTTEVVPTVNGDLVTMLEGRPAILKYWIAGEVQDPLPLSLLPAAGRILAQIHQLAFHVPKLRDIPPGTRRLSVTHESAIPHFADKEFGFWLSAQLERVRRAEANREPAKKLVHGDLFADNLVVSGDGQISVLDWETISLDDPLLDLGMTIVGLGQEGGLLSPVRMDALVAGYREIRALDEADLIFLPIEVINAAVIIAYHRYVRHNIRFPDPSKSESYLEMIKFVGSVEEGLTTSA